jgi:hypothetical protein
MTLPVSTPEIFTLSLRSLATCVPSSFLLAVVVFDGHGPTVRDVAFSEAYLRSFWRSHLNRRSVTLTYIFPADAESFPFLKRDRLRFHRRPSFRPYRRVPFDEEYIFTPSFALSRRPHSVYGRPEVVRDQLCVPDERVVDVASFS